MLLQTNFQVSETRAFFEMLREEMQKTPEAEVGTLTETASFTKILDIADIIRAQLHDIGSDRDAVVAICAEKSPHSVAAILGVLSSGLAYAPLDPSHPDTRLTSILDDLAPPVLIVDDATRSRFEVWARRSGTQLLTFSELPKTVPPVPVASGAQRSLAAVLHTSGSTGKPKRVLIEAPALDAFQSWVVGEISIDIDDCVLSHAPFAFDLSFLDIFASLAGGACLALADTKTARNGPKLVEMMQQHNVTIWHSAPSALKLVAEAACELTLPQVRCVLFAGEPMQSRLLRQLFRIFPNARFINIYGCTETNDTFFYDVPRIDTPDPLPLGRKLPYVDYILVDNADMPVSGEGQGELWVRCPTMMRGYSDQQLTAKATGWRDGVGYYRTGDMVRRDANGMVHFIGRNDTIVKLSGVRVDLNEIEACLQAHPLVDEAAAYVDKSGDTAVLNAFVSSKSDELNSIDLRLYLMKRLPTAAIPRKFTISIQEVPKNSNGKACRRMLEQQLVETQT
ncbi:AMP-binding protein [Litoreibacter janthinus]|uniref:Amino acid adenylation domain-containing protein n=1 Tax=Litoreibacter janthinus TaxID=670154 RepID=A0A1I6GDC8_9RHOB|nr:AMP-binding protein [Litoreibacter janthinus]SFR40131.1 amino acid adenylation domain-containing protein [Litoreibacter janthinus]